MRKGDLEIVDRQTQLAGHLLCYSPAKYTVVGGLPHHDQTAAARHNSIHQGRDPGSSEGTGT